MNASINILLPTCSPSLSWSLLAGPNLFVKMPKREKYDQHQHYANASDVRSKNFIGRTSDSLLRPEFA